MWGRDLTQIQLSLLLEGKLKFFYFSHIYSPKGQVIDPALIFFSMGKGDLGCWLSLLLSSVRILLQWTFLDRSHSRINTSAIFAHVQEFLQLSPISVIVPLLLPACVLLKAYPKFSIFWDGLFSLVYLIKPGEGNCQWFLPSALLQNRQVLVKIKLHLLSTCLQTS